jgi:hypothetical protein
MIHSPWCAKPDWRLFCRCGKNAGCLTCGWGQGAAPCDCTTPPLIRNVPMPYWEIGRKP